MTTPDEPDPSTVTGRADSSGDSSGDSNGEDSSEDHRPVHRLAGPDELIRAVPYLLGFHPDSSLVLVGLRSARLVVTARLDLIDVPRPGVLADTLSTIARGGAGEVVALIWDGTDPLPGDPVPILDRGGQFPWRDVAALVLQAGDHPAAGALPILDLLLVHAGRWWSLLCARPDCCPPEGHPLPPAATAFAAAATAEGIVALPSRAALVSVLDPLPGEQRRLRAAVERSRRAVVGADEHQRVAVSAKRALFALARASAEPSWTTPGDAELARLGVALGATAVRDAVWLGVDDGRLDGRPLWLELARRLPAPYDAVPAFLFGWASWRAGDGALARAGAERALAGDPTCAPADMLLAALAHGINPHDLPRLRRRRGGTRAAAMAGRGVRARQRAG